MDDLKVLTFSVEHQADYEIARLVGAFSDEKEAVLSVGLVGQEDVTSVVASYFTVEPTVPKY